MRDYAPKSFADRLNAEKLRARVRAQGSIRVGRRKGKGSLRRWVKEMRRLGKIR